MAKRFDTLPNYAREHRASPRRKDISENQRQVALVIQGHLSADVSPGLKAATLNPIVRLWHHGWGNDDCELQSEGVLNATPETIVEVEHGVEVAELIRHLIGNATAVHRATYRTPEELAANPPATWDEVRAAVASGDEDRINEVRARWGGVEWSEPPPDYVGDLEQLVDFMSHHYVRVLVTAEEHERLGKAASGATMSQVGMPEPAGAHLSRYSNAGIRVAIMNTEPATSSDLWLPS